MPKVLRIINRLNLGGPTYNAAYLSKYMESGYETKLVAGMKDETEASSEFIVRNLGLEVTYLPTMKRNLNPWKDLVAYFKLKEIIRKFKPDLVHTHAAKAGAIGRLAAYHCKVPVIVHTFHGHVFHSYFHPVKTKAFLQIERYLASISSKIIAISRVQKEEIGEVYKVCPSDKIAVIPLGFDLLRFRTGMEQKRKAFRKQYNLDDDEIAVGIIGRLVPIKNHGLFLNAFKKVFEANSKVRGFIIGDGEEKLNLLKIANELCLSTSTKDFESKKANITFTSWIKDVDQALAGLDIVTLTSFNEGTPVSLIEAQASNKPIACTDVGGVQDVVVPGETALISPSNDTEKLSKNMLYLVENEDKRIELSKCGYQYVHKRYSFERLVKDTLIIYDRLLSDNT